MIRKLPDLIRNDTAMTSYIRLEKTCQYCQNSFTAKTIHTRYCSHTCNRKDYKKRDRENKIEAGKQTVGRKTDNAIDYTTLNQKELLTLKAAAALLNVTPVTMRQWILAGVVKSYKIGKKHIVRKSEIPSI